MTEKWVQSIDNDEVVGSVLIDFRKAFDLINHQLLLRKLKIYGINGNALKWMESYLHSRTQRVFIENKMSNPLSVRCGVPQGSILGPL